MRMLPALIRKQLLANTRAPSKPMLSSQSCQISDQWSWAKYQTLTPIRSSSLQWMKPRRVHHLYSLMILLLLQLQLSLIGNVIADPADYEGLMRFMNAVDDQHILVESWKGDDPCNQNWIGVQCYKGRVWNLILESFQLQGTIPADSLSRLDKLRRISLKNNLLSGNFPTLSSRFLRTVWLSSNEFQGPIPDIFSNTPRLNVLDLADNKLTGPIPNSLTSVPNLRQLTVQNNSLSGSLPALDQPTLISFNVSHNHLSGQIPTTLQHRFDTSAFSDNPKLCGSPLINATCPAQKKDKNVAQIVGIVVGDFGVLMLITLAYLWYYKSKSVGIRRRKQAEKTRHREAEERAESSGNMKHKNFVHEEPLKEVSWSRWDENEDSMGDGKEKLVVVNEEMMKEFRLEDLLRASAELLGEGKSGKAYRAVMDRSMEMVVKRLNKHFGNCEAKEFHMQAQLIGCLRHPQLVPLLAYYYGPHDKLLVYSFMPNSSLFSLLHGKRRRDRPSLDWTFRLRIARSVARGLAYLHRKCKSQTLPHGNIKSTNVLFDKRMEARVADFGLAPLLQNSKSPDGCNIVAFTSPEYVISNKLTRRTDVYGFGVLLLELLTGKLPSYYDRDGESQASGVDLPQYVQSVTEANWTAEVFDTDLGTSLSSSIDTEEMTTLLKIAIDCTSSSPDERPKMSQVLGRIEALRANVNSVTDRATGSTEATSHFSSNHTPESVATRRSPENHEPDAMKNQRL